MFSAALYAEAGNFPDLPAKVINVTFAEDTVGEPPTVAGEDELAERTDNPDWTKVPLTKPDRVIFTSDYNTVTVEDHPLGLDGRGVLLSSEDVPADNHRTSGIEFELPFELIRHAGAVSLSMDVVKGDLSSSGAISVGDVARVVFRQTGQILADTGSQNESVEVGRYVPVNPVRITFQISDGDPAMMERTFQILLNGEVVTSEPLQWSRQSGGAARHIQILNTTTGGYAQVPSQMAVGNIEMTIDEWK